MLTSCLPSFNFSRGFHKHHHQASVPVNVLMQLQHWSYEGHTFLDQSALNYWSQKLKNAQPYFHVMLHHGDRYGARSIFFTSIGTQWVIWPIIHSMPLISQKIFWYEFARGCVNLQADRANAVHEKKSHLKANWPQEHQANKWVS